MGSTSVHLPSDLLRRLDRAAKRRRVSRNRLITEACRAVVSAGSGEWPRGFFAPGRLPPRDAGLLRATFDDWMTETLGERRSKKKAPF